MNLLIDIGNTNLRWTRHEVGRDWEIQIARHSGGVPLDLLAAWEGLQPPARLLVSNVGGAAVAESLARVSRAFWGLEPEFVATRPLAAGVRIAYEDPARFGVDRWLALIAAHAERREASLILDAGSAATFDLLLADGRHLGGLILPGIEMMRASLLMGTHIPRIESEPVGAPWATDTAAAVAAGSVQALVALAARLYDRLAEESGGAPRLILTGGDAQRLRAHLDRPFDEIPDLVLRGLALVGEESGT
ncbi:type III pantothenate kinase [Thiocystis violacea]|uniref:type III pantothenate kinase n=1 Tax=Thiocystis violacea TaxID=13725 RepID=UPI001907DEF7|nr:type III pantothenate kinase [Thiocystis violacea]MBK1716560.1 type III pantothenate kinase [Thiocystis violacea]